MDITEDIKEEETMSRDIKITENTKGGDSTETEHSEKSKRKKDLNHRRIKIIQKYDNNVTFITK